MNGPDHYREAERLLEEAESCEEPGSRALWCLELAKLHAALASGRCHRFELGRPRMGRGRWSSLQQHEVHLNGKAGPIAEAAPTSSPGPSLGRSVPRSQKNQ